MSNFSSAADYATAVYGGVGEQHVGVNGVIASQLPIKGGRRRRQSKQKRRQSKRSQSRRRRQSKRRQQGGR